MDPAPFGSPLSRWVVAYGIGLNAFGLVLALAYVVGGVTHQSNAAAVTGFLLASAAGIATGRRINRAMKARD